MLSRSLADATLIDEAKKALMYGKDKPTIAAFREQVLLTRELVLGHDYTQDDLNNGLARLHAALGMRSEADEILQHELTILSGGIVLKDQKIDEVGDLAWYAQLYANAIGTTWVQILQRNVAKLMTRFKGLTFSESAAQAPDKTAEARAQAGVA